MILLNLLITLLFSTMMYLKIRQITHMNKKLLLIDNLIVAFTAWGLGLIFKEIPYLPLVVAIVCLPLLAYLGIQLRFWRTPKRKVTANEREIVSSADGNIIYINRVDTSDDFVSVKKGRLSDLKEFTKSGLITKPCWHIGINMTPFDVHKNCSPIDGKIIQSIHTHGKFHSLKDFVSLTENERHTYVFENELCRVGVVQIASRRVRRIDSYVKEGDNIKKGDWVGMIRFGSQVDMFLPIDSDVKVKLGQQVYAKKTIIAELI